mgnify:CR=1 FL=1
MKVEITPITENFAKESWKLRNNPELWKFMDCDAPLPATLESETEYLKAASNDQHNKMFAVVVDGEFAGYITLKNIAYGAAELSYCIMRQDLWGKGFVSKATLLVLQYAYEELRLDLVYLYINPKNTASYRNAINKHFVRVGSSFIKPEVERLEMTRTGWEKVLK